MLQMKLRVNVCNGRSWIISIKQVYTPHIQYRSPSLQLVLRVRMVDKELVRKMFPDFLHCSLVLVKTWMDKVYKREAWDQSRAHLGDFPFTSATLMNRASTIQMHGHDLSTQGVGLWPVGEAATEGSEFCPSSMARLVGGGDVKGLVCEMGMWIRENEGGRYLFEGVCWSNFRRDWSNQSGASGNPYGNSKKSCWGHVWDSGDK
jgi:hypothetical protein